MFIKTSIDLYAYKYFIHKNKSANKHFELILKFLGIEKQRSNDGDLKGSAYKTWNNVGPSV